MTTDKVGQLIQIIAEVKAVSGKHLYLPWSDTLN